MVAAGLTVRTDPVADPDVDVEGLEWTGPRLHRAVWGPQSGRMRLQLRRALVSLAEDRRREELLGALQEGGVEAAEGGYADLAVQAAAELAREKGDDVEDLATAGGPVDRFWRVSGQIGAGSTSLGPGFASPRSDLGQGPSALVALVDDVVPEVQVRLTGAFLDRRADQRRDVLDYLLSLSAGCRVVVVVSPFVRRRLADLHRERLPATVMESCNSSPRSPAPGDGRPVPVLVEEAQASLDPAGSNMTALVALYSRASESATYRQLRSILGITESHARKIAERLAGLGLVERLQDHDGRTRVSLRPAGRDVARDAISEAPVEGRHGRSPAPSADGGVTTPSHSPNDSRVTPRASTGEGEGRLPAAEAAVEQWREYVGRLDRPAEEAETATAPAPAARRASGQAPLQRVPYADLRGAVATTGPEEGEVALVDAPAAEIPDPRTPLWGYHEGRDQLVVGCKGTRAVMQLWVTLARALSSKATFETVLDEDRLQAVLDEVPRTVLERKNQVGGLAKGRYDDAERLESYLLEWTERLCDLTREYDLQREVMDDREANRLRSEITNSAKGLCGTMVHLLRHAGVEVTRLVYADGLAEFDEDNLEALAGGLAHQAAIESHVEGYPVFRHLYEDRPDKREFAIAPPGEVAGEVGELIGSFVVVGRGVDRLTAPLRRQLERPDVTVEDAPELGASIPLRRQGIGDTESLCSREAVERAAEAILPHKMLGMTDLAIDVLHQWLGTSLDVCRALSALSREGGVGRLVEVDELRAALTALDPSRLVPGLPRTAQQGLAVLLAAEDEPLSQAEVCRRAGISPDSWRRYKNRLVHGGWVEYVDEVGRDMEALESVGWRVQLPLQRREDAERRLPWFVTDDRLWYRSAVRKLSDAFCPGSEASTPTAIVGERPELRPVLRAIRAGVGEQIDDVKGPAEVTVGRGRLGRQAGLAEWDAPRYSL